MAKFPDDVLVVIALEGVIAEHGLDHLRVRKRGDLITIESGPKKDPIRHVRMRRATRQWYTLEIATHTGLWQQVPLRARAHELLKTVISNFPWVLMPIE